MKSIKILVLNMIATFVLFTGCGEEEKKEPSAERLVSRIDYYRSSGNTEMDALKYGSGVNIPRQGGIK